MSATVAGRRTPGLAEAAERLRVAARTWPGVARFAAYLVLALALLGRTWFGGHLSHRLVGVGGDPWEFVWFLSWFPHALGHGQWPFFTTALMAPGGANLLNTPSIALPSLLMWPATSLFGPVISYDVLCTLALALTAWVAYRALCRVTANRASAWVGGLIYGFGGYTVGQTVAHAHLLIAVFPPLAAMLLDDVRRERRSAARTGALLGLCAAAQAFVSEEILATAVIMSGLALILCLWMLRPDRALLIRYVIALGAAAAAFALLAGPAIVYQLAGPEHVQGLFIPPGKYVNDLAGFVIPNHLQWLSTSGSRHVTNHFAGYDGEWGAYLGVPLLALLIYAGWRLRSRQIARAAGLLLVVAGVFSLGPHLRVWGHDTGIPMPWTILNRLPLIDNAVPSRFNLYLWLAAGTLVALLLDDLRRRPLLGRRTSGWVLVTIALVPIIPAFTPSGMLSVPAVATNAAAFEKSAPHAKTVLITPFASGQIAMYAQAQAGFAYRIPDGSVFVPGRHGAVLGARPGPLLYALETLDRGISRPPEPACARALSRDQRPSAACRSLFLSDLRRRQIDAVIVSNIGGHPRVARYARFFGSLLGPPRPARDASVFAVPARR
jgi:hypothetical protein